MLSGGEKSAIRAVAGIRGTIGTERRLRIKMNNAKIGELIPVESVYPGVDWLLRHTVERR
jgi:hypothetical protein